MSNNEKEIVSALKIILDEARAAKDAHQRAETNPSGKAYIIVDGKRVYIKDDGASNSMHPAKHSNISSFIE